ncbi:helix-turn-helix transcriptional regulator [Aureimonas psammosilenae]|uniref:helix-turn-helix transcriptional regulator n=1 Tax=Aureimonas psammosilenae TaxID=2495496 RepID=UPI001F35D547|nr:LuxR C-terminal-related transcriptional regulator [Aureimonas psammosilenae]
MPSSGGEWYFYHMPAHPPRSVEHSAVSRFSLAELPVPLVFATYRIIRDCNAEFAALFGFERAELIDTSFSRLYPQLDDFVRTGEMWRSHLPGGQVFQDERIMRGSMGRQFWAKVNGRSRRAADPFAEAIYCFEPLNRPVNGATQRLTGRQRQILALVAQGLTNAEIGLAIGLSQRTVEAHRLRLSRAVGVRNATELVAWFLADGGIGE